MLWLPNVGINTDQRHDILNKNIVLKRHQDYVIMIRLPIDNNWGIHFTSKVYVYIF